MCDTVSVCVDVVGSQRSLQFVCCPNFHFGHVFPSYGQVLNAVGEERNC